MQLADGDEIQADDSRDITRNEGEEEEEETRIDVTIPYCRFSLGSELYFVKMPNFLSIDRKPFDPAQYEDEMEEDEVLDEEGRARLKLKVKDFEHVFSLMPVNTVHVTYHNPLRPLFYLFMVDLRHID